MLFISTEKCDLKNSGSLFQLQNKILSIQTFISTAEHDLDN